jgi:hypothetical protein
LRKKALENASKRTRQSMYHNNAWLQQGVAQFHLTKGGSFPLSFRTESLEVIQEYFKGIPVEEFVQHVPLTRKTLKVRDSEHEIQANENRYHWLTFSLIFLPGICFVTMAYIDAKWQDDMSTHAPVVCMKMTYGTRAAGTVKNPDQVYAEYLARVINIYLFRPY